MNVLNDAIAAMEASKDDTGREQGRSSSLELGAMAAGAAAAEAVGQGRGAVDEDEEVEEEDGDVVMADGVGNEVGGQSGENEVVAGAPEGPKEQNVVRLSRSRRPQSKAKVVKEEWVPSDEESEFVQELATAANEDISDADDSFLDESEWQLMRERAILTRDDPQGTQSWQSVETRRGPSARRRIVSLASRDLQGSREEYERTASSADSLERFETSPTRSFARYVPSLAVPLSY
jgi:hypothetical protein